MNRLEAIDNFLKSWCETLKQNPNFSLTNDAIYYSLTRIWTNKSDATVDFSNLFPKWIEHFKNNPNIEVKLHEKNHYFCLFSYNAEEMMENNVDLIKMYIPINKDYLEEAANTLFTFLAQNEINHASRIGKKVRNDNIVIRVASEQDAKKIQEFVKSHEIFQKGKIHTNPFLIEQDGIAFAADGFHLSINTILSKYIYLYLKSYKNTNQLDAVSKNSFHKFMIDTYNSTFASNNLEDYIKEFQIDGNSSKMAESLTDHLQITKLIISSLNQSFSIEDFFKHYQECNNSLAKLMKTEHFKKIVQEINEKNLEKTEELYTLNIIMDILYDYVEITANKSTPETPKLNLEEYIKTGNLNLIARTNNLRTIFQTQITPEVIKSIMQENHIENVEELIKWVKLIKAQTVLDKSAIETYIQHGETQLMGAIKHAKTKDFQFFSNEENRKLLKKHLSNIDVENMIKQILLQEGYSINNDETTLYINRIIEKCNNYNETKVY